MSGALYVAVVALLVVGVISTTAAVTLTISRSGEPTSRSWSDRTTRIVVMAALGWTVVVGTGLLLAPLGSASTSSSSSTEGGATVTRTTTSTETLLEQEGPSVVVVLLIPIGIALVGALARGRWARPTRIGAGVLLAIGCVLGLISIGLFYLPAAVLLTAAGLRTGGTGRARRESLVGSGVVTAPRSDQNGDQ